jgi:dephospho-CoA kinase
MVWNEVKKQGLPLDEKNVGHIADKMRKDHGMDIWAAKTLKKISTINKEKCIIIDGIRNIEEIEIFKKKLGTDFIIIAVTASDEIRQKRFLNRGREDDSSDVQDFKDRDKRELNWGLGNVIATADIIIPNEYGMSEFKENIRKTLEKILSD